MNKKERAIICNQVVEMTQHQLLLLAKDLKKRLTTHQLVEFGAELFGNETSETDNTGQIQIFTGICHTTDSYREMTEEDFEDNGS